MKRIYFIITMLLFVVSSNAKVLNYRGVNVTSYIGDTLLVRPFPQNDSRDFYKGFKDFYEFTNETSEFNALANYKFDYKENNQLFGCVYRLNYKIKKEKSHDNFDFCSTRRKCGEHTKSIHGTIGYRINRAW